MWTRFLQKAQHEGAASAPPPPSVPFPSRPLTTPSTALVPVTGANALRTTTTPAPPTQTVSVMDIYKKLETKKMKRVVSYEHVLRSCFDLIQKVADKEEYHTVFEVPAYVVGLPLYNVSQCIAYIICQLRKQGFYVRFLPRQYLYISWKLEDIRAPGAVGTVGTVGSAMPTATASVITDPNRPLPPKAAPAPAPQRPAPEERPLPPPPPLEPMAFGAGGFSMYEAAPPVSSVPSAMASSIPRPDTKTIHTDTLPVPVAGAGGAGRGRRGGGRAGAKTAGAPQTLHSLGSATTLQAPAPEARIPFPPPLVYDPYDLMIEPSAPSGTVAPPSLLPQAQAQAQAPTRAEHAVKPSGKFILKLD